jgi:hypothetical protein
MLQRNVVHCLPKIVEKGVYLFTTVQWVNNLNKTKKHYTNVFIHDILKKIVLEIILHVLEIISQLDLFNDIHCLQVHE